MRFLGVTLLFVLSAPAIAASPKASLAQPKAIALLKQVYRAYDSGNGVKKTKELFTASFPAIEASAEEIKEMAPITYKSIDRACGELALGLTAWGKIQQTPDSKEQKQYQKEAIDHMRMAKYSIEISPAVWDMELPSIRKYIAASKKLHP